MAEPTTETNASASRKGLLPMLQYMQVEKITTLLWMIRMGTIVFTVLYIIPLFGVNPYNCYYKALLSNAATSALRLHQRLRNVRFGFTREFLAQVLLEDSCHYLFFSLIFLYVYPMTLVLLPVFLFAVLHYSSHSLVLLEKLGKNASVPARFFGTIVENQQKNFLRLISFTEIFLMPMAIFMIFSGKGNLLTPFVYYRFVTLRYASRRNPYTRTTFHELRMTLEMYLAHHNCPAGVRVLGYKLIGLVSRLAPTTPT